MWRAECKVCDFKALHLLREEAEAALLAHVQHTHHVEWFIVPVPVRPEVQVAIPPHRRGDQT